MAAVVISFVIMALTVSQSQQTRQRQTHRRGISAAAGVVSPDNTVKLQSTIANRILA